VTNVGALPRVRINGRDLAFRPNWSGGFSFARDFLESAVPGDSAHLVVDLVTLGGEEGTARADLAWPGPFRFTSHDPAQIGVHEIGSPETLLWTAAAGAANHAVGVFLDIEYEDHAGGNHRHYEMVVDTVLSGTSLELSPAQLVPVREEIALLLQGWIYVTALASAGPTRPGDPLNVQGDGTGCFVAVTGVDRGGFTLQIRMPGAVSWPKTGRSPHASAPDRRAEMQARLRQRCAVAGMAAGH